MSVQELVLNQLVHNEDYFGKVLPHLKTDYFEDEASRILFGLVDSYAQKYNSRPTAESIIIMAKELKISEALWDIVIDTVGSIEEAAPVQNQSWLLDQTEKWMQDRATFNVIMDSVDIYSNPKRRAELGEIPSRLADALIIGFDDDMGMIYWEMAAEQYDYMHSAVSRIPFGVEILNKITNGGCWKKSLCALNAGINVGKTTCLIDLAVQYAAQGLDVIYFTFEVQEHIIRHRLDCRMLEREFSFVEAMSRPEYIANIETKAKTGVYGNIAIKEMAAGSCHVGHCRSYIKDIMKRKNFKPVVILFDYLGEMASERLPQSMMGQTDLYFGSIAREMRALMFEFDALGWTALQFQRGMQNTKDMSLDGNADSITVPKILDLQIGISIPDEYASINQAWGAVLKNRFANKAKMKNFVFGLNQDLQMMSDVDGDVQAFAAGELHRGPVTDSSKIAAGQSVEGAPKSSLNRHKKVVLGDSKALNF